MNSTERQKVRYATLEEALKRPYDLVQLMYHGRFSVLDVKADGMFTLTDFLGDEHRNGQTRPECEGTYIGDFMFGTEFANAPERLNKLFLYDCTRRHKVDIRDQRYFDRYKIMRTVCPFFSDWIQVVPVFAATNAQQLWDHYVRNLGFRGLVFRSSKESYFDQPCVVKKTNEPT